ncbi:MAG: FAD-binding protein [Caldicoprobacterales bacterium]
MGMLSINQNKCDLCGKCIETCPFGAMDIIEGRVVINEACKMCRICLKTCPGKAIVATDGIREKANINNWKGILVFAEQLEGQIHPVTLELIGKSKELASKMNHPVTCIFIGHKIKEKAEGLLEYGLDKVFVYDHKEFEYYRGDIYTNAFEHCITRSKPSIVLVGATSVGRSLAPRVATRFRTGLTADCTTLDVKENSDLIQIRPAFGGNIMAQIVTEHSRPQFATVRYKVMEKAQKEINLPVSILSEMQDKLEFCSLPKNKMKSSIEVLNVIPKEKELSISEAEVIVAGGRGIRDKKDLAMLEELAQLLGGQTAVTRPLVEAGWAPYTKQIGLSGRTVRPRLIITCGISGAVQFTSCMNSAQCIIAINKNKNAPIFKTAHYGIVGDLYEIVPQLCGMIRKGRIMDAV